MPAQRDGERLVFVAGRVPPMGYASFLLERGEPPAQRALLAQAGDRWRWEGARFRLQIDPRTGAITSLKDTASGAEWVDASAGYGLNQFIYVLGGEGTRLMYPHYAEPKYEVFTHSQTSVKVVENGAIRAVLRLRRTGRNLPPVDTWITIWWDGRLEFLNVLHKEATLTKEAGYFAFPFRFAQPKAIRGFVELPYGILQVEQEQLTGGCREWYATHSFAALSDGRSTAYLATPHAPLLTFNGFFKGLWRGKLGSLNGSLFAYVFNNYWDTNYKASQGGDLAFGFTLWLKDEGFDPAAATRFGWETLATMCDPRRPENERPQQAEVHTYLPTPGAQSLLQVQGGTVLIGGITMEEEYLCIRLYNPGATPAWARLHFSRWTPKEARRTDLAGRTQERLPVRSKEVEVGVPARRIVTVALR